VDWLLAATIAVAAVAALAGIDIEVGGLRFRSHSAPRVLLAGAVFLGLRLRIGVNDKPEGLSPRMDNWDRWLLRLAMKALIAGSIAAWLRFLLSTVGGADSYGYVSASQLLRGGRLIDQAPIADWLPFANRLDLASPMGWAPAADRSGIVPSYPLGLPAVMAAFSAIGGVGAVFLVAPVCGLVALAATFRLARDWCDERTAWIATALVAVNPLIVAYAKQPMSDVPATAWLVAATTLALRQSRTSGAVAGVAAGAALLTRPALAIAAAMVPLIAARGPMPLGRGLITAAGVGLGVALQLGVQATLYGRAFASGYGSVEGLFSLSFLAIDARIYASQLWVTVGPIWMAGLAVGLACAPAALRNASLLIAIATTAPYLFWVPSDHWETLRFLLPAITVLSVIVAVGLVRVTRLIPHPALSTTALLLLMAFATARSESLLRRSAVWDIQSLEARYPLAGQWLNVNTPPNTVALANQHSGSLRWYGRRPTLRWDLLQTGQLVPLVRQLESHGATVVVALEGSEVEMFDRRFGGEMDRLRVDHLGGLRNVSFRRLASLPSAAK
jgi:hypothetical protein